MMQTAYEFLGVKPTAKLKEIRRVFRARLRAIHPDLNPQNRDSAEQLRLLLSAYDLLRSPEKRAAYDRSLRSAPRSVRRTRPSIASILTGLVSRLRSKLRIARPLFRRAPAAPPRRPLLEIKVRPAQLLKTHRLRFVFNGAPYLVWVNGELDQERYHFREFDLRVVIT